tara:strand:- start:615 stop:935 length:321 start_codon:yes stop_codon:yes gene_type:complete
MSIKEYLPDDPSILRRSRDDAIDVINDASVNVLKDKLRRRRKEMKLKQSDLAESVGLKQPAISRIENHENRSLSVKTLQEVAHGLDCVLVVDIVPRSKMIDTLEND